MPLRKEIIDRLIFAGLILLLAYYGWSARRYLNMGYAPPPPPAATLTVRSDERVLSRPGPVRAQPAPPQRPAPGSTT